MHGCTKKKLLLHGAEQHLEEPQQPPSPQGNSCPACIRITACHRRPQALQGLVPGPKTWHKELMTWACTGLWKAHPQRIQIVIFIHLGRYKDTLLDDVKGIQPNSIPVDPLAFHLHQQEQICMRLEEPDGWAIARHCSTRMQSCRVLDQTC